MCLACWVLALARRQNLSKDRFGNVSGVDTCDKGLLCWYVNEENIGSCIDQCTGTEDAPMCPSGTVCDVTNDGVLTLCLPTCDPLLVDCPGDQICFYSSLAGDFICDFDGSGEAGAYGDPCEYINVCDPGLFCANPENVPGCQAGGCCSPRPGSIGAVRMRLTTSIDGRTTSRP